MAGPGGCLSVFHKVALHPSPAEWRNSSSVIRALETKGTRKYSADALNSTSSFLHAGALEPECHKQTAPLHLTLAFQ